LNNFIRLQRLDDGQQLRAMIYWDQDHVAIEPDGRFQGSPGAEKELVYVLQTDRGQETILPEALVRSTRQQSRVHAQ